LAFIIRIVISGGKLNPIPNADKTKTYHFYRYSEFQNYAC